MTDRRTTDRRSQAWFGAQGRGGMVYRSWMRNQGFGAEVFDGRPVIGIATSASELAPCNVDQVAYLARECGRRAGYPSRSPRWPPARR